MDIREWKGSTAKLYIALLFSPGQCGAQTALMAACGMTDKATFFKARTQLVEVGKAYLEGREVHLTGMETIPANHTSHEPAGMETIPPLRQTIPETLQTIPEVRQTIPEQLETIPEDLADWLPEPESPRARCAAADRSGGRPKQLEALAYAFTSRFPAHPAPSTESLKRLLQIARDSAEDVDEVFERVSIRNPEHPFSYVRTIMEREAREAPVATGTTPRPLAPDELPAATAEQRAKWKRNDEMLRKAGLMPLEGHEW